MPKNKRAAALKVDLADLNKDKKYRAKKKLREKLEKKSFEKKIAMLESDLATVKKNRDDFREHARRCQKNRDYWRERAEAAEELLDELRIHQ